MTVHEPTASTGAPDGAVAGEHAGPAAGDAGGAGAGRPTGDGAGGRPGTPGLGWRSLLASVRFRFFAIIVIALCALSKPLAGTGFYSMDNLLNVTRNQTTIVVMAIAAVFVIAAGEIDLSFAAVIPVAAYAAGLTLHEHGVILAVLAALGVGVATGLFNGIITVYWQLPSFIVTLGTMSILGGFAIWITNSQPVIITDPTFVRIFGNHTLLGIPVPVFWTVGVALLGYLVLVWTPAGKKVIATGANRAVAESCGIRTVRVRIGVLVVSGVGGAVAGLLYGGLLGAAQYDLGNTDLLTVLAATIIGGTALTGGRGSVFGALFAALLLGLLSDALIILGLGVPQQMVLEGAVVIVAIALGSGSWLGSARLRNLIRARSRAATADG